MRTHRPLNLHRVRHTGCTKCSPPERDRTLEDGICTKITSTVDGAPLRCVGEWAFDKTHFLTRYFGIFGPGMHNVWEGNVHYIEICSGPGRCVDRDAGDEIDGTALAILQSEAFQIYKTVTFIDKNSGVVASLNRRIAALGHADAACALEADYNRAEDLVRQCLVRAPIGLRLVFLDPTDCSVPMETVVALSRGLKNVDFIINVATGTDATRNLKQAFDKPKSKVRGKYESFLGSSSFFLDPKNIELANSRTPEALRAAFRQAYRTALGKEGYEHFGIESVKHYYDLLFASKHKRGLDFWTKAQTIRPDSQATFGF